LTDDIRVGIAGVADFFGKPGLDAQIRLFRN